MDTFLIIADDFTGALDTGVCFSSAGSKVQVSVNWDCDLQHTNKEISVIVLDAETRHISPKEAGSRIKGIVRKAKAAGIKNIMKKTDSALRGNIGSELSALLKESGQMILHFFPAFPELGRTTRQGVHYVKEVPVAESSFGRDPFEPVRHSKVADIIREQSDIPVRVISGGVLLTESKEPVIAVYDTETEEELAQYARQLMDQAEPHCIAGCAGLAKGLKAHFVSASDRYAASSCLEDVSSTEGILVSCGSVNPVTVKQLAYAEDHHFKRMRMLPEQKLNTDYFNTMEGRKQLDQWVQLCKASENCILDTNDQSTGEATLSYAERMGITKEEMRIRITKTLGLVTRKLLEQGVRKTLFVTGGDALLGFMQEISVDVLIPVRELAPGIVLSEFTFQGQNYQLISKSGGFGEDKLLVQLSETICRNKKEQLYKEGKGNANKKDSRHHHGRSGKHRSGNHSKSSG